MPTIMRWPNKIISGKVSNELIISTDILPTVLEAINISRDVQVEGVSLWKHITASQPVDREVFYWHYPHYHRTKPGSVIRDGNFKFIYYYEDERTELYNLETDPREKNDLAEKLPEKTKELKIRLDSWLDQNQADFPKPNKNYKNPKFSDK